MDDSPTAWLSLSLANLDVGTLLPSTGIATIFLDSDGRVKGFTPAVSEIWPLKSSHIGAALQDVPHRVVDMPPLPEIGFLTTRESQIEHEVRTEDNRWFLRTVLPRRSRHGHVEGAVVTFVEITDRKRMETRLVVEHAVTRLLSDAESFRDVAKDLLQAIASGLDAEFCALWMLKRKPDRLSCYALYPQEDYASLRDFQRAARSLQFSMGEGLPGRVWSTRKSEWIADIAEHPDFPRAEACCASGLASGVAFPILSGSRFLGVIEIFLTRRLAPQRELLAMMESLGQQIGDFVHRRQMDEKLREEQRRKSAILESSLDCIVTMDHEGRIVDFNPSAVRTLGFPAAEVIGQPMADVLIPERFRPAYHEGLMHYLATGTGTVVGQRLELAALRADGAEVPVEVAINAVMTEEGSPFFIGFLRDISERKLEKRRQLRRQKIEYFLGKAGAELSASLDPAEISSRVTKLCVPGLGDCAVLDLLDDDGTVHRMDVAYGDAMPRDIARRLKSFPPVKGNRMHPPSRALFTSESVLISDFNEAHLRNAAQSPEHAEVLRAMNPRSFISVPLVARGTTFGVLTLVRANSARRYGQDDVKVVEELAHRAAIAIDNARLYQQAEQANRAKSDFLANMSHEIRTPMTAVLGYADILATRIKDPVCSEKISIIKRNGQFLLEIINDILDLSKIEAGRIEAELERFELAELVGDVLSLMQLRASEKGLQLLLEYKTDVPEYVVTDPIRLRQILVNLIGNAIKFTETGKVTLGVGFDVERRQVLFEVVDTGIGISPELQDALFQPFNQGDTSKTRKYGGTGLGLAISLRLAEMLGGTIIVESKPGVGSTFTVSVDVGASCAGLIRPSVCGEEPAEDESIPRKLNCRVLVVDDREDIRLLARHFVVEAGGRVVTTCDGLEAISAVHEANQAGTPFDIILMDMQMPNLDGREATALLRSEGFRQPIIAITADAMQGDREKTLMAGCDGYLSKPIDKAELISLIATFTNDLTPGELEARRRSSLQAKGVDADRWLNPKPHRHKVGSEGATTSSDSSKSAARPRRQAVPRPVESRQTNGAGKVLIVDDWPDTSEAMAELLKLSGWQPRTAQDGRTAVDAYLDFQPAAVLMDLGLPDMDGCDVLRQMRQCAPLRETLFIAISGRGDAADIRRAHKAGFQEYLVKPADINEVLSLLENHRQPVAVGS